MQELLQTLRQLLAEKRDREAYKLLYQHYHVQLIGFAVSMVRRREVAEELVSDVFLKIWQLGDRLGNIENLRVYLYIAVRNQCLNYLSQKKKITLTSFDDYQVSQARFEVDPEQLMITAEMVKGIEQAVERLPPRCKMIFKLIREEGFRNKDVARILDISVNTIDVQLAIAIKKISQAINFDITGKSSHKSRNKI